MTTLSEFHLFPLLPSELRLKVWNIVLSKPRVVSINCKRELCENDRRIAKAFPPQAAPPAILHVCRESRFEGLSVYQQAFRMDLSPVYTYISFEQDTVSCSTDVFEYLRMTELLRIRRLVLDVKDAGYFAHFCMENLKKMVSLKELELGTQMGKIGRFRDGEMWVEILAKDFYDATREDPGWECPRVRIVDPVIGEELFVLEGGASHPGWKSG